MTNPDPAGCATEESVDVLVLGAPVIAAIEIIEGANDMLPVFLGERYIAEEA